MYGLACRIQKHRLAVEFGGHDHAALLTDSQRMAVCASGLYRDGADTRLTIVVISVVSARSEFVHNYVKLVSVVFALDDIGPAPVGIAAGGPVGDVGPYLEIPSLLRAGGVVFVRYVRSEERLVIFDIASIAGIIGTVRSLPDAACKQEKCWN